MSSSQPVTASPSSPVGAEALTTIGDMARAFNVSQRALRFYEDRGLLSPRREGSARLYGAEDRRKLASILRAKRLGFTLAEMRDLVRADSAEPEGLAFDGVQVAQQIAHLERQREGIEAAIAELRAAQRQLSGAAGG